MALSVLNMKPIGIAISGIGILTVFTIMQWFNPWIMVLVALVASVMIGQWVSKQARSGEG